MELFYCWLCVSGHEYYLFAVFINEKFDIFPFWSVFVHLNTDVTELVKFA